MSRSGKPEPRSTTAMQEEQKKLSPDAIAMFLERYSQYGNDWENLAQTGAIPSADLEKMKSMTGVV